jgi:hypothetical protein
VTLKYIFESLLFYLTRYDQIVRLCGSVVRVPGCRARGPGFDSQHYQLFWVPVDLERDSLSLMRINEELLERKHSG